MKVLSAYRIALLVLSVVTVAMFAHSASPQVTTDDRITKLEAQVAKLEGEVTRLQNAAPQTNSFQGSGPVSQGEFRPLANRVTQLENQAKDESRQLAETSSIARQASDDLAPFKRAGLPGTFTTVQSNVETITADHQRLQQDLTALQNRFATHTHTVAAGSLGIYDDNGALVSGEYIRKHSSSAFNNAAPTAFALTQPVSGGQTAIVTSAPNK